MIPLTCHLSGHLGMFTLNLVGEFSIVKMIWCCDIPCHLDFATTTTSGVFVTEVIPSNDLGGSSWNKYVYRTYTGLDVDQDVCTTLCAYDFPNSNGSNCHFTVLDSNKCYLGSFDYTTDLLASPVTKDLYLKTCN